MTPGETLSETRFFFYAGSEPTKALHPLSAPSFFSNFQGLFTSQTLRPTRSSLKDMPVGPCGPTRTATA